MCMTAPPGNPLGWGSGAAGKGEARSVPTDLIVWRGGPDASRAVEEKLVALRLEPADLVERTELSNIIDVDLSSDPAEAMP